MLGLIRTFHFVFLFTLSPGSITINLPISSLRSNFITALRFVSASVNDSTVQSPTVGIFLYSFNNSASNTGISGRRFSSSFTGSGFTDSGLLVFFGLGTLNISSLGATADTLSSVSTSIMLTSGRTLSKNGFSAPRYSFSNRPMISSAPVHSNAPFLIRRLVL